MKAETFPKDTCHQNKTGLICESVKADGLLKKTAGSSCVESSKLLSIMSQRKQCITSTIAILTLKEEKAKAKGELVIYCTSYN